MTEITRRGFVKTVAGTGAALTIVPRHVLGRGMVAPSDIVNVAAVGIGGPGGPGAPPPPTPNNHPAALLPQNMAAVCAVDDTLVDSRFAQYKRQLNPPPSSGQGRGGGGNRPQ